MIYLKWELILPLIYNNNQKVMNFNFFKNFSMKELSMKSWEGLKNFLHYISKYGKLDINQYSTEELQKFEEQVKDRLYQLIQISQSNTLSYFYSQFNDFEQNDLDEKESLDKEESIVIQERIKKLAELFQVINKDYAERKQRKRLTSFNQGLKKNQFLANINDHKEILIKMIKDFQASIKAKFQKREGRNIKLTYLQSKIVFFGKIQQILLENLQAQAQQNAKKFSEIKILEYTDRLRKQAKELYHQFFDKEVEKYTPRRMMETAILELNRSIEAEDRAQVKYYYKQCYKFAKNIDKYLFQLFCRENFIYNRKNKNGLALNILISFRARLEKIIQNLFRGTKEEQLKVLKQIKIDVPDKQGLPFQLAVRAIAEELNSKLDGILQTIEQDLTKEDFIKELGVKIKNLDDQIVGCRSQCPMCGMKCILPKHEGGHRVLSGYHSLLAFGGSKHFKSNLPVLKICRLTNPLNKQWKNKDNSKKPTNEKTFIADFPDWKSEFSFPVSKFLFYPEAECDEQPSENRSVSTLSEEARQQALLKNIWANIEDVLIATKFTDMNPSINSEIRQIKKKGYFLTYEDLMEIEVHPLTGVEEMLREY